MILTIISVAAEEFMESYEVRAPSEITSFSDQYFLDKPEVVDDYTGCASQIDAEQVAVVFAELRERLERSLIFAQKMQAADEWPRIGAGRPFRRLLRPGKPPHQQHYTYRDERKHVRTEFTCTGHCEQLPDRYPLYDGGHL